MSSTPERPLDITELFRALADHGVEHLVIGGVAAQVHGRRRTTKDLDVTPAPDAENYERLAAALVALEARPAQAPQGGWAPSSEQLRIAPIVSPLTTMHGELHILNEIPGAETYAGMRTRALEIDLDGVMICVVSVDDLIRMKQAAGRLGDLEDIEALRAAGRGDTSGGGPDT